MKYVDDLMRHLEGEYDHITFLRMEEEDQDGIVECWRDHDSEADQYHDQEVPARAVAKIQNWLTDTYEQYLTDSYGEQNDS